MPITNEQIVARMQAQGFTYFRQISAVLSTITLIFGFLLITVLLTVSVNQRLGEIAALRALGFSRSRAAGDVFAQGALLVAVGGVAELGLVLVGAGASEERRCRPGTPRAQDDRAVGVLVRSESDDGLGQFEPCLALGRSEPQRVAKRV